MRGKGIPIVFAVLSVFLITGQAVADEVWLLGFQPLVFLYIRR